VWATDLSEVGCETHHSVVNFTAKAFIGDSMSSLLMPELCQPYGGDKL
jgi:hypothetical protein